MMSLLTKCAQKFRGLLLRPEVKGVIQPEGMGVIMNNEQYEKLASMINTIADETSRREILVAESLEQLKQVEYIKTYTAFVRDVTNSIACLSGIEGTEGVRKKLIESLDTAPSLMNQKELYDGLQQNKQN